MKRFLKIAAISLLSILLLLIVTPFLFKDKIKAFVEEDINNLLNAEVYFGDVGLSFIRNFPNARVSIEDFGVVGTDVFALDTLAHGKRFDLVVDLMSVIAGDEITIKKVLLDQPRIHAIVLEDGRANWDIMKEDSTAAQTEPTDDSPPTESTAFQIGLQEYQLTDANIRYEDATLPMDLKIIGMNHKGSGDFSAEIYELRTQTNIRELSTTYDGIAYLNKHTLGADVDVKVDISENLRVDFLDNEISVNALGIGLNGFVAMPGDDIDMDLNFATKQTTFKSLLSLVPAVYTADFQDIETDGQLVFDGFAKGTYNETSMPGFGLNAKVSNARMKYPDLPEAVTGIQMDLSVNNPDGDLEKTHVLLKQFHADLGANPIDASLDMTGLENIDLNGALKAKLNLGELTQMFPIEGTELKGLFSVDATAKGRYSDATGSFPVVGAVMEMKDGYVKNAEYPAELSDFHFQGALKDVDGQLTTASLEVPDFHLLLDGEPLDGSLQVRNFEDPTYSLQAKGVLDLEKLMQIYPIDSMTLKGKLIVEDFSTRGTYSDIEAERYTNLPTSGRVQVQNLVYQDNYLVAPVTVDQGTAVFTPSRINLQGAKGKLGKSDYRVDGYFDNYLAYALMEDEMLGGSMRLSSNTLDLNEWMEYEEVPASGGGSSGESEGTEEVYEAIPVPGNLDLAFQADLKQVLYENLTIENMSGALRVVDETVQMQDVGFQMLGSDVVMSGEYQTQNPRQPAYHFFMDMQNLAVKNAVQYFSFVKEFAPALQFVDGVCNTQFGIKGLLRSDMMPILESINSQGLFDMLNGGLKQTPMMASLSEKTKIANLGNLNLAKARGSFEIKDGFLIVAPIDLKAGDVILTIGGRQNLAGNLDYSVKIDAPSGKIDQAAIGALSNLTGTALQTGDRLEFNLKVVGTHTNPSITGGSGGTGSQVKNQLTETAEEKLNEQLGTDIQLNQDSIKEQISETKEQLQDTVRAVVEETKSQVKDTIQTLVDDTKQEIKEEVGETVGEIIGEDAKNQLDDLKDKFGLPKLKKKKKKKKD